MTINEFLQFVILISFVSIEELLPCFYSISGIYSKLSVTSDQIHIFLRNLNSLDGFGSKMREFIKNTTKTVEGRIPIKEFSNFLICNIGIFNSIKLCKESVIENIITKYEYKIIEKRNSYYNSKYNGVDDGTIPEIPKESCINKFYRILILKEPSPFHFDYNFVMNYERVKDINNNNAKEKDKNIILLEQYIHRIMIRYHKNLRNGSCCRSSKLSNRSLLRNSSSRLHRSSGILSNNNNNNNLKSSKNLKISTTPFNRYRNNKVSSECLRIEDNNNNCKKRSVKQGVNMVEGDENSNI